MIKHFPRLTTVVLSYVAAFLVFGLLGPHFFQEILIPFGIGGVFVAGMLFAFSFTSSIGAVILVAVAPVYPASIIALVGGIGTLIADITILNVIKHDLNKEVERIANSPFICSIGAKHIFCTRWFRNIFGALILASPLPDELGIAMMSAGNISKGNFALISFIVDVIGIYALVSAAAFFY